MDIKIFVGLKNKLFIKMINVLLNFINRFDIKIIIYFYPYKNFLFILEKIYY